MTPGEISLVPRPAHIELSASGASFELPSSPTLSGNTRARGLICEQLTDDSGSEWAVRDRNDTTVRLVLGDGVSLGDEGYVLEVTPAGVTIEASTEAGLFYGSQTLRQLVSPRRTTIPEMRIEDAPSFRWRGMHLDVSRHFFNPRFVRRYIDFLARHKLNVFHWHLTDDDGWRVELDSHPELTERTAWRGLNEALPPSYDSGDDRYGGFYTKDEISEILTYATDRHIMVVPEIDVPGHSKPVTVCHPELLCEGAISQFKSVQDVPENLLCAGREQTFDFLETVIGEIAAMFPSPYLHMGGDERPEGPWEQCPRCRKRIADEGLRDTDALQGYFMERVRKIVSSHGKTMVGWNEITHGNTVDRSAVVMAWQDPEKGLSAAEAGYPVVMAPAQHTYFDLAQAEDPAEPGLRWAGVVTLKDAYDWQPIPTGTRVADRVLGIEGCLWSETLVDEIRAEYMAFPRICALSEVAWTPREAQSWTDFSNRLSPTHLERLSNAGVNYRPV